MEQLQIHPQLQLKNQEEAIQVLLARAKTSSFALKISRDLLKIPFDFF
jgi:hypothetical protein